LFLEIFSSREAKSTFKVFGERSTNIGMFPELMIEDVVATKEKGVVTTFELAGIWFIKKTRGKVPFAIKTTFFTPHNPDKFASNSLTYLPSFVYQ
jgi:hypothetical protein